jgi:hypothetical protein
VFNIQDPYSNLEPDARERIEDLANKIVTSVDEIADNPFEALQALSAVVAYVISEGFASRSSADQALAIVTMVVAATVENAEQEGNTVWSQKVTH